MKLLSVDLSLEHRDEKDDEPIDVALKLLQEHKIGLKCSTVTPTAQIVKSRHLKKLYKSASATLRHNLDCTTFKTVIKYQNLPQVISHW